MKAEGTAQDPDANHVRDECLKARTIGLVELHTPEVKMGYHECCHSASTFVFYLCP